MSAPASEPEITREESRFITHVDEHEALIDFRKNGNVLDAHHTFVPKEIGGKGIASALVRFMMNDARDKGEKIRPTCSYVETWLKRHPEYEDLRAG